MQITEEASELPHAPRFSTHQFDPFTTHNPTGEGAMGGGWRDVGEAPPLSQGVGYGICLGKSSEMIGACMSVCMCIVCGGLGGLWERPID